MLELRENCLDVDTYFYLRRQVGWPVLTDRQAECAVDNCLYNVCAYMDGEPVGMGRIVGDGAVISYVQDLVVLPKAQGQRVGSAILDKLKAYAEGITEPGSRMMLCLMCAKGREPFYEGHGFIARPTDALGPGMIMYIEK